MVDLVMWLTGERPERVFAVGTDLASEGSAFRYDDHTSATLSLPSGAVARVTANFGCVHRHQHVLRVFGTAATFLYDDAGPRLHRSRAPEIPPERLDLDPVAADKGALIAPFVDGIVDGRDTHAHTQGILDAMAVCFAIDRAKEQGAPLPVEYV
jgi:predicted dehydrogenase